MNALKQAREALGWSQTRAMAALRHNAAARGIQLPKDDALKRQLSRWENGQVTPSDLYRELLCDSFGRSAEDLGFKVAQDLVEGATDMLARLALSRSIGPTAAQSFAEQLNRLRVIDRQLGVRAVQAELDALSSSVAQLLSHAVLTNTREPLAALLADISALAAWHALDQGNVARSWELHERAKSAAREANDLAGLAHAMGQQAYALLDLGQANDATQLVRTAREAGRNFLPRPLQSWLAAAEAEFCAAMGDAYGARKALANAATNLDLASEPGPPYIGLDDVQLRRWRGNVLVTLRDREAISELMDARNASEVRSGRATASLECDIATTLFAAGERAEAREHLHQARGLAQRSGSIRQLRRLDSLRAA